MVCKYCQAELEENSTVCPACGADLTAEETLVYDPQPQEADTAQLPGEEDTTETGDLLDSGEAAEDAEDAESVEASPAKSKLWLKITAAVCCAALLLGLASLVFAGFNGGKSPFTAVSDMVGRIFRDNDIHYKDAYTAEDQKAEKAADKVVATVGDRELTNSKLQVYYWTAVYEFVNNYNNYVAYLGLDFTKPLSEQVFSAEDGMTWEQYFLEAALNSWHRYQSLLLHAEADGYTMSDMLKEQLEAIPESFKTTAEYYGFADVEEMVRSDMGPAASMDAYMDYLHDYYGSTEYFEGLYQSLLPDYDEVAAYYDQHAEEIKTTYKVDKESGRLIDVRHILVTPKGGTTAEDGTVTYSQEEWDTCKTEADSLLEAWLKGEGTEESFAALAAEATEDPGSAQNGGLYTYVYEGQMVPAFNDWCFDESRKPGDIGMVQTEYGYHIMYFVYGEEGWIRYAEQELVTEKCTEVMKKAMEEHPLSVNYKKIVLGEANLAG